MSRSLLSLAALLSFACLAPHSAAATVVTPTPTTYIRRSYTIDKPFFDQYWWVGFIIMFLGFVIIVLVLYAAVQCHFSESDQRRRRDEIESNRRKALAGGSDDDSDAAVGSANAKDPANPLRTRRH